MNNQILSAILLTALAAGPAAGQTLGKPAGVLNDLFDHGTPVEFGRTFEVREVRGIFSGEAKDTPRPTTFDDQKEALTLFVKLNSARILAVPGVAGVDVGIDCPVTEPHVHIRPHTPAVVIRLDGRVPDRLVYENLMKEVPEMGRVIYRLDKRQLVTPAISEVRCWLPEGC